MSPDFQHRMRGAEKVSKMFQHDFEIYKLGDSFYSIGKPGINSFTSPSQRDIEIHMMLSYENEPRI